ncbi:unnamed protein product [Pleuronectes platessa]|uniref:Uncharacterized protein n=1 Tax=Pleuronectes platessa TaxID=8262 RepID=A0A9N7TW80_PLEPL|nr:unnamed protein product [Pleuronectes platessa]
MAVTAQSAPRVERLCFDYFTCLIDLRCAEDVNDVCAEVETVQLRGTKRERGRSKHNTKNSGALCGAEPPLVHSELLVHMLQLTRSVTVFFHIKFYGVPAVQRVHRASAEEEVNTRCCDPSRTITTAPPRHSVPPHHHPNARDNRMAPQQLHRQNAPPAPESSRLLHVCNPRAALLQFSPLTETMRPGSFFKGFINCDQPRSAVTHVIQAAVMTPSKGCPTRRQATGRGGGGLGVEQGLRSFPPSLEPQPHTLRRRWTGAALKNNTSVIPGVWGWIVWRLDGVQNNYKAAVETEVLCQGHQLQLIPEFHGEEGSFLGNKLSLDLGRGQNGSSGCRSSIVGLM